MAIARPIRVGMSDDGKTLRTNLLAGYARRRKSLSGVRFPEITHGIRTRGSDQVQSFEFLVKRALGDSQASRGLFDVLIFAGESGGDVEAFQFFASAAGLLTVVIMFV